MPKRKGRTLRQVEDQRTSNEQERQDFFKKLKQQEHEAAQERDLEEAKRIIEVHKERTFVPNQAALHQPIEIDYTQDARRSALTQGEQEHETKRRAFSNLGLISRMPPANREQQQQQVENEADRQRRAMYGIPAKPKGYGRPPWA